MLLSQAITDYSRLPHLRSRTANKYRHLASLWRRHAADVELAAITADAIEQFRCAASRTLSPRTVEGAISDVLSVLRHHGHHVAPGRRLRRAAPHPSPPSIDEVAAVYLAASDTVYRPRAWWRCWLALVSWTGLRLADLKQLTWPQIAADRITITASKTGATHRIPAPPWLQRHLETIHGDGDSVFGLPRSRCELRLYRGLDELSAAAGVVPPLRPQRLRQFAITQWTRANPLAGTILHGSGLGTAMRHYVDPLIVLQDAAPLVQMPTCFMTAAERRADARYRQLLLDCYWRATPTDRKTLIAVARRLSS